MKCPRCQHENEAGAKFCEECAAPLARACATCGRPLSADREVLPRVCAPDRAICHAASAQRFDSPESYTPKHLAEKILTSKAALEGERKLVTVLFADLKGSMELLADRDPEEARKLLDPVLERMMEAVHHYEGTVNQVMGDGIMALFGAPVGARRPRGPRLLCRAADAASESTSTRTSSSAGAARPCRFAWGSIRARWSCAPSAVTCTWTTPPSGRRPISPPEWSRWRSPGSTLVTGDTLRLAEGYVQVRPLGTVPVKGLEIPTPVYELTGTVPARSRLQASAARGLTRFVGRDSELRATRPRRSSAPPRATGRRSPSWARPAWEIAALWEFTRSHRTHGWLVLESGSVSYGKATPYLPVIELLEGVLPDPGARRPAGDPRTRGRQAPDARPGAGAALGAAAGAARCPR